MASFVRALPDRVVLVCLGIFLAASLTTTFDVFRVWTVWPLAVLLAIVLWRFLPKQPLPDERPWFWGSIAALVVALVFVVANAPFVSEWIDPTRDPGLYALEGIWLIHSPATGLDIQTSKDLIEGLPGISSILGNFGPSADNVVHLQGGDLLPGVIAMAGFAGGVRAALEANLVVGGAALIAVYGLARRILGPVWALVPQLALGLSVAFVFFARGTYSEIIMLLVCAAGLTYLISAVRSLRVRDFVVSGVFVGAASMTRIDGPIAFIGPAVVLGVAGLGFVSRARRPALGRGFVWFAVAAAATTVLGLLGLLLNKASYVNALLPQARLLWAASVAICVVAAVCWFVGRWCDPARLGRFWRVAAVALSGVIGVVLVGWLTRPLWYVARFGSTYQQNTVGLLQKQDDLTVDPTRSYEEQTMSWIGWYFGWPTVALAIVGFVLLILIGVRRRSLPLVLTAAAPLAVAALYFTRVSITPDQVWAYRRLLPIVTPGFLIAAVFPLRLAFQTVAGRIKRPAPRNLVRAAALVGVLAVAAGPVVTWNGLLLVRDRGNQYTEITKVCADIRSVDPGASTVLYVKNGAPVSYSLAIKAVCDVNVLSVDASTIPAATLAGLDAKTGDIPVVVYSPTSMPAGGAVFSATPAITTTIPRWDQDLDHLPTSIVSSTRSIWFGRLTAAGKIVPVQVGDETKG